MVLMVAVRSTMALFSFFSFTLQSGQCFLGDDLNHQFLSHYSVHWYLLCSLASPSWRSAPLTTWLASQSPPSARPSGRSSMMRTGIAKRKSEDNPMLAHNGHNKLSTHVVCLVNGTDQRHKDWGLQTATDSSTILKMMGLLNKSLVLTFFLSLWSMFLLGRWCRV